MNNSYFMASRVRYVESLARPLCIGTEFQQKSIVAPGGACLSWLASPSPSDLEGVQRVFLAPTAEEAVAPEIPPFVATMKSLRTLAIPQTFIAALSDAVLPQDLACLQLSYKDLYLPRANWSELSWPEGELPKVRGIFQHSFGGPSAAWARLGMTHQALPNLEFFSCEINNSQAGIDVVSSFTKLQHLELELVQNATVFPNLPTTVQVLSLTVPFTGFSLQEIGSIPELRALKINGARCDVDFELLLNCPQLVEVNILNSKKLRNIDSLLSHPKLKSVYFLDCGKPFKGDLKERFKTHGFERVEVDYA